MRSSERVAIPVDAVCQLRGEDVFLTKDQAARALAAAGMNEGDAEHGAT